MYARFTKFGKTFDFGYGILTKNPSKCTENDFKYYNPKLFIYHDGYWYIVKTNITLNYIIEQLLKNSDEDDFNDSLYSIL